MGSRAASESCSTLSDDQVTPMRTQNLPANPYDMPTERLDDKPGYPANTVWRSDGVTLVPFRVSKVEGVARSSGADTTKRIVADTAGARARRISNRMRYRRKAGRVPDNTGGVTV